MGEQYWFKANKSGYGWHPHTWEGFLIFFLYIGFLIHSFFQIDSQTHSVRDTLIGFLPRFLIFTAILIIITYMKGESMTWGDKEKEQHKIP